MKTTRRELLAASAATKLQGAAQRPNILWICTDQQRWDTIASLGNQFIRTPNLDRLAASGVSFTHAYCQNPICTPSRGSFMTGCYPSTVHVHRNGNSYFPEQWRPRLAPRIFRDAGYDCGLAGKLHLSSPFNRVEPRIDDGYRIYEWSHHPSPETYWPTDQHAYQRWLREKGADWKKLYKVRKVDGYPEPYQAGMPERYHEVTWASELAQDWMKGGLRGPWFASLHVFAPHPPFDPAPEYLERMRPADLPEPAYRAGEEAEQAKFSRIDHQTSKPVPPTAYQSRHMKAAYYAMIEHIDHEVGRMLSTLESSGQKESTIVVFMSDHGEMLGDRCLRQKGCRFFDGAVRVPLIISWPGKFAKGVVSPALVELTDILPTLMDSAGLPVPDYVEGRSLKAILEGRQSPLQHREMVRSEYHDSLDLSAHSRATMIRDSRHKLVVYHGTGLGELFDLAEDPTEASNLFGTPAGRGVQARMTEQMLDHLALRADLGQPRIGRF